MRKLCFAVLDVRRLRVLRQVALSGTIAEAARALHLTGPAVSQQLATLEREAGVRLVERDGRSIRLTEAARLLVAHTETVLAQLEAAAADLEAAEGRYGGQLRCAAFPSAAAALLAPACSALAAEYPMVRILAHELEPDESMAMLRAGDLDLAVAHEYDRVPRRIDRSLTTRTLLEEPMLLAVPADGPHGTEAQAIDLRSVAEERWIAPSDRLTCGQQTVRACADAGFVPEIACRAYSYDIVLSFVVAGLGVALVPAMAISIPPAGVRLLQVAAPPVRRRVFTAVRRGSAERPSVVRVLEALQRAADEMQQQTTAVAVSGSRDGVNAPSSMRSSV
jgi:DNA-binding transcriptional LysR family regulator